MYAEVYNICCDTEVSKFLPSPVVSVASKQDSILVWVFPICHMTLDARAPL